MAKGKQEKVEQGIEKIPEQLEVTPSKELEAQLQAPSLEQLQASLDEAQREIGRKEDVILKLKEQRKQASGGRRTTQFTPTPTSGDVRVLEILLEDKVRQQEETGVPDRMVPILQAEITGKRQQEFQQSQMLQWQARVEQEEERFNQKIEELELDPNDEKLEDAKDAFDLATRFTGDFERAHRKLDRIKIPPKEGKEKTVKKGVRLEDLSDEDKEELKRQVYENDELLKSPKGEPSGAGQMTFTREQIRDMSIEEFERLKPEIDKARKEGKIK